MINILGFIIAGLIIGLLARALKPGRQALSLPMTLVLGVIGSLIGGVVATFLGTGDFMELNILGFIVAVIAAVVLLGLFEGFASRRRSGLT